MAETSYPVTIHGETRSFLAGTPYGDILSAWDEEAGKIRYTINVPSPQAAKARSASGHR